jgi:hypothetical protein
VTWVVLEQHEAAQLRPEMADDARRQRRDDGLPVGGQPALAAEADDLRAQHQILDQDVLVALEAGAGGDVGREDALLGDGQPVGLAAADAAGPRLARRLGLGALLHAARLQLGPALHALELGDLRPQLGDRLLERGILRQQPLGQGFQRVTRQACEGDLLRSGHAGQRSGQWRSRATPLSSRLPGVLPLVLDR